MLYEVITTLAAALTARDSNDFGRNMQIASTAAALAITLPNSREAESEADQIGIELAARAGYDPRAAITLWQKMGALGEGQPPQFLSTHPSYATRIADLRVYAERVMPLYERARRGG